MKRFINIGHQTQLDDEGPKEFAFYCTVKDQFETFTGSSIWISKEQFTEDYDGDDLQRYLSLIPIDWN